MPRTARNARGGVIYHVFNRGNLRLPVFTDPGEYRLFEEFMQCACDRLSMRILAYCLMPNHWHMMLWPRKDPDLARFVGWVTQMHTQWWHLMRGTVGTGHLYQGRYRTVEIQDDRHLFDACRYVERNALSAGLAPRAEDWRWGSLWRRNRGEGGPRLSEWPFPRPGDWIETVNAAWSEDEVETTLRLRRRERRAGP